MTEEKSKECCSCNCGCCNKSGKYLLSFMLFVIIVLLSGIFYTMQGAVASQGGCPKVKGAMCPIMPKGH